MRSRDSKSITVEILAIHPTFTTADVEVAPINWMSGIVKFKRRLQGSWNPGLDFRRGEDSV
jgi:hypothetical protein